MIVLDGLSADSKAEFLAMNRMLELTSGFVLAFVAINHQSLCEALIHEYVSDSGGRILAVELHAETGENIVHQIGHCLDSSDVDRPLAIFVRGIEDMLELTGTRLQYIEDLNYSRSDCGQRFSFPLVFWAPKYAIRDFSRRAQDLWSCRSDLYSVEGNLDDIKETVLGVRAKLQELLKAPERAGEVRALTSLLHDVREELPPADDPRDLDRKDEYDELRAEIEEQLADLAGYSWKLDERLAGHSDPRMRVIIEMLSASVYGSARIAALLETAGLSPGDYPLETARLAWGAVVPDAARQGKLTALLERIVDEDPSFGPELERRLRLQEEPEISVGLSAASRPIKVFLCHSSSDKSSVRTLRSRLLDDGIQPWFDEEDIIPGQDWDFEIRKAIRASDIVLVCLSKTSISKVGYLQKEIRNVLDVADEQPEGTIFLIPARLEPVEVPERFRRWQWVDLFEEKGYPRLIRALQPRNP